MLGDFDLEAYTATSSVASSIALFVIFMYLVNLIMLNLLIAIMGDIFAQIQESARAKFLYSKALIIIEFEDMMSDKDKKDNKFFPTWVQVLRPTADDATDDDDDDGDTRVGKLRGVKKSITDVGSDVNDKFDAVNKKVDIVDAKLEDLAADNAELKNLLLQLLHNTNKVDNSVVEKTKKETKKEVLVNTSLLDNPRASDVYI